MTEARRLRLLDERARELETCGYCPKLCRASCPVSNAEPRDSLTPWGKMSLAWFAARGELALDHEQAAVSWACTGCYACRDHCDHRNPVSSTLFDARADAFEAGVAPLAAVRVVEAHAERLREVEQSLTSLATIRGVDPAAKTALLVGCGYVRDLPAVARDAIIATIALVGPVRLVEGCCGAPLLMAGDRAGFAAARRALIAELSDAERVIVVDPGCAVALGEHALELLVDVAAEKLRALRPIQAFRDGQNVRWHDPCQLGRGLGRYEEPRAVLGRLLGRSPDEFPRRRVEAACSGGGGLLPATMPEVSARIADDRLDEHRREGGGVLVTACASSLRRLSGRGVDAVDLVTLLRQGLTEDG